MLQTLIGRKKYEQIIPDEHPPIGLFMIKKNTSIPLIDDNSAIMYRISVLQISHNFSNLNQVFFMDNVNKKISSSKVIPTQQRYCVYVCKTSGRFNVQFPL